MLQPAIEFLEIQEADSWQSREREYLLYLFAVFPSDCVVSRHRQISEADSALLHVKLY